MANHHSLVALSINIKVINVAYIFIINQISTGLKATSKNTFLLYQIIIKKKKKGHKEMRKVLATNMELESLTRLF